MTEAAAKLVEKGKLRGGVRQADGSWTSPARRLRRLRRRRLRDRGRAGEDGAQARGLRGPGRRTPGHAILASNTSGLSITEIGEITLRPDQVVGFHFFGRRRAADRGDRGRRHVAGDGAGRGELRAGDAQDAGPLRRVPGFVHDPSTAVWRYQDGRTLGSASGADRAFRATAGWDRGADLSRATLDEAIRRGMPGARRKSDRRASATSTCWRWRASRRPRHRHGHGPGRSCAPTCAGSTRCWPRWRRAEDEWGEHFEPPVILRRLVAQGRLGAKSGQGFYPYPQVESGYETAPVKLDMRGETAVVWLDNPPANSLGPDVDRGARRAPGRTSQARGARAMVLASPNPTLFCAGADIKAFTQWDVDSGREHLEQIHGAGPRVGALADRHDRRRQRHGAGRRLRDRDGVRRPDRRHVGVVRPAGDQPRDHPGLRRHAAAAAAGRARRRRSR